MRKILAFLLVAVFILSAGFLSPKAVETEARDLSREATITTDGFTYTGFMTDGDGTYCNYSKGSTTVTVEHPEGIGSVYLQFGKVYSHYTVTDNATGKTLTGESLYIHEFLDLEAGFGTAPVSITLTFDAGKVYLGEITVFSSGPVPERVQRWQPPLDGGADILMLPAHGDDDHLYFAGLLPLYAGAKGLRVQVVYMTDHWKDTRIRVHEMLDGLWNVGVRNYPIFGDFDDFRKNTMVETYREYKHRGVSRETIVGFVMDQIRRFKPQVVVGHDILGEYGHGMHMVYSDAVQEAVTVSMDPNAYPDSAQRWGTWDVPKTYLHLWKENPIVLDYDIPLERFNGLTAFQASQRLGFASHISQQIYNYKDWLNGVNGEITKATQIETFSPCEYGLFRTTVGPDVAKNDFMENLISLDDQIRLEQERIEQERLEKERLEQERIEQERLEKERIEQERLEKERLEQERLEKERLEQERLEKERLEQERLEKERMEQERIQQERRDKKRKTLILTLSLTILLAISALIVIRLRSRGKKSQKIF